MVDKTINNHLNNPNVLKGLSRKTTKKIVEANEEGKQFNINHIDKLPLRDLIHLRANIAQIRSSSFEDQPATIEQGFQKTKQ